MRYACKNKQTPLCRSIITVYKPVRIAASRKRKLWAGVLTIYVFLIQLTVQNCTQLFSFIIKKKKGVQNYSIIVCTHSGLQTVRTWIRRLIGTYTNNPRLYKLWHLLVKNITVDCIRLYTMFTTIYDHIQPIIAF